MIQITPTISINENDIQEDFVRASGPGGQNVNKVSSAVLLRYDSTRLALPDHVRRRLAQLAGKRMTADGIIMIKAQQFRTQERNREDALARLIELIREATEAPEIRIATRPTRGSRIRVLDAKRRRSEIKQNRKTPPRHDD
ncbi:MAG TPA: alternative ribosome rescue aminoacyl-tRNA hydrolase ArfB [Abditibacteriaceae bacterium]